MRKKRTNFYRVAGLAVIILTIGATTWSEAKGGPDNPAVRRDILSEVQTLYDLTEQQAITRLAAEIEAAELERLIRSMELSSYAGSWFDDETWRLHVAISGPADRAFIKNLGGTPVLVSYNLNELKTIRRRVESSVGDILAADATQWATYVDYRMNRVIIGVSPERTLQMESALKTIGLDPEVTKVVAAAGLIEFSAAVRGGDPMCNHTFTQPPVNNPTCHDHPCSIGASVVGGYITAGHCGEVNSIIHTDPPSGSGQLLGTIDGSTMTLGTFGYQFAHDEDGAWVDTAAGWTPKPKVNGYSQGIISINAKWSGMLEAPLGTTVCRYGQNPNGPDPDCGPVEQKNFTILRGGQPYLAGLKTVSSVCTFPGDSGGPYLMATGQIQGTNIGGNRGITCPPQASDRTYFQPVTTTLDQFDKTMLTTHGAVKPTINGFDCPSFNENGSYLCVIDSYNSQGVTDILWSSNIGHSSTTSLLSGTCSNGQAVSITLDVTNPYGTRTIDNSFTCDGGLSQ